MFLNSNDKVSGSNNNATYKINWDDFLPRDVDFYKVVFSFQTSGGYYRDNYSQFTISAIGATTTPTFQCAVLPIYNSSTGFTSIIISAITGIFYSGNYIIIGGLNYLIVQSCYLVGNTMIIQGNPTIAINTTYSGVPYTILTGNTVANYTGSISIGQTINYNGNTFNILMLNNLNTN